MRGIPSSSRVHVWCEKTRMAGLQSDEGRMMIDSIVWAQYVSVTATSPQQMPRERTKIQQNSIISVFSLTCCRWSPKSWLKRLHCPMHYWNTDGDGSRATPTQSAGLSAVCGYKQTQPVPRRPSKQNGTHIAASKSYRRRCTARNIQQHNQCTFRAIFEIDWD